MPVVIDLSAENLEVAWPGDDGKPHKLFQPWTLKKRRLSDTGVSTWIDVTGPSGCGKSSLVYVLAGLKQPSAGSVTWTVRSSTERSGSAEASERSYRFSSDQSQGDWAQTAAAFRREVSAYCFQTAGFVDYWTLRQSLGFAAALANVRIPRPSTCGSDWITRLFRKAELGGSKVKDIRLRYPSMMSGGQRQRAALCIALESSPHLLLVDEPAGNLDKKSKHTLWQTMSAWQDVSGGVVLAVTHDEPSEKRSGIADLQFVFTSLEPEDDGETLFRIEDSTRAAGDRRIPAVEVEP